MVTLLSVSVPPCFIFNYEQYKREQLVLKTGRKLNGDDDVDLFNAKEKYNFLNFSLRKSFKILHTALSY